MSQTALAGKKIGFVGAGNMAEAIIKGLLAKQVVGPTQIAAYDILESRLRHVAETHGIKGESSNAALVDWAEVIVLAIKPQVCQAALGEIGPRLGPDKLVISVAAGVAVKTIKDAVKTGTRIIRTIPNTPAMVLAGVTGLAADASVSAEDFQVAETVFGAVGRTVAIDEKLMDAATGLSGSGPAYVFVIIEALADGGVKMGMSRQVAEIFAAQTVLGAAKLFLETGLHPGQLKDMVTSPGGTTIAGLHQIELGGVRAALMNAVEAATRRSEELGRMSG